MVRNKPASNSHMSAFGSRTGTIRFITVSETVSMSSLFSLARAMVLCHRHRYSWVHPVVWMKAPQLGPPSSKELCLSHTSSTASSETKRMDINDLDSIQARPFPVARRWRFDPLLGLPSRAVSEWTLRWSTWRNRDFEQQ